MRYSIPTISMFFCIILLVAGVKTNAQEFILFNVEEEVQPRNEMVMVYGHILDATSNAPKIGRASCRERV